MQVVNSPAQSTEIYSAAEIQRLLKVLFDLCSELSSVMPERARLSKHFSSPRCSLLEFIRRGIREAIRHRSTPSQRSESLFSPAFNVCQVFGLVSIQTFQ